jgi:hypothetical protein
VKDCGATAKLGLVKTSCTLPAEAGAVQLSVDTACAEVSPALTQTGVPAMTVVPLLSLRIQL